MKHATAEFTLKALRKAFIREGDPAAVMTDNGRHFSAKSVTDWLRQIGSPHVFTAPQHPQTNGLVENIVKTFTSVIHAMNPTIIDDLEQKVDNFLLHNRNAVHCFTREVRAVSLKGRHLKSNVMGLQAVEIMFSKGHGFRMANGIVIRKHEHYLLDIINLEDELSHRRHLGQARLRTDNGQEETKSPKSEQLQQIQLEKTVPTVKADLEHTQASDEANNDLDVGNEDNQAIESNDESEKRLQPPPAASPVQRRKYRPPEGCVPRRSQRFRDRNKNVDIIDQGRL